MRNLIDFLRKYLYWFVFLVLETVSLVTLFHAGGYQESAWLTTANTVVGSVYSFTSSITSYLDLQTVNRQLEADNEELRKRLDVLERRLQDTDTVVLNKILPPEYEFVGAHVVNSTLHRNNNLITIDKGEADGIRPEMGVVCSRGVVGVVYLTSDHYSVVIPLLNTSSKVSCRLRGSEHFGTMQWQRGAVDISYVAGVPRHAKVKRGEVVETNGFSDIFPPGVPIGRVTDFGDSADGMSYRLRVHLFADFKTLRNVSVITNYSKPERRELEYKADSLMTN
ncbi:MAG: rod shape-determining protein MreC [Bacteroides sp.]|nr:rod shape-determining protein MreC [Roseburia sp.]MCM1346379.1 rod shape-determining protein MreC [Bacteroides sp.]MCM1420114.1 rod shape-determining protein MreC [Bacteroides sp.]